MLGAYIFIIVIASSWIFPLYLISSLIALWSEKMLDTILIFLNLLKFDL